jgi:hypothetical protein
VSSRSQDKVAGELSTEQHAKNFSWENTLDTDEYVYPEGEISPGGERWPVRGSQQLTRKILLFLIVVVVVVVEEADSVALSLLSSSDPRGRLVFSDSAAFDATLTA